MLAMGLNIALAVMSLQALCKDMVKHSPFQLYREMRCNDSSYNKVPSFYNNCAQ